MFRGMVRPFGFGPYLSTGGRSREPSEGPTASMETVRPVSLTVGTGPARGRRTPPTSFSPPLVLGGGRPAALAADGRFSRDIAGLVRRAASLHGRGQTSPFRLSGFPAGHGSHGPTLCTPRRGRRSPQPGADKKTIPPAGSAAGGTGPLLGLCIRLRVTAAPWYHHISFAVVIPLAALPA